MPDREDAARSAADAYYVDWDDLNPAELIGPPLMDVEAAEAVLSRLDGPRAEVPPKECVRLFDAVAGLRFTNWDYVEILWTPERRKAVDEAATRLYRRLVALVARDREPLLQCLERGVRELAEFTDRNLKNPHYRESEDEFSTEVFLPYQHLDCIRLLLGSMGLTLPADTEAFLGRLDDVMRQSLPAIAKTFRDEGHPIDPVEPRVFPSSFWWAYLAEE